MVALSVSSSPIAQRLFNDRYRFLEEIGVGSFSRVFLAQDTHEHNRLIAIKRLRQSGLPTLLRGTARQSFRREAAMLGRLRHPRIPRLRDSALGAGFWFLAIDYIAGETLEHALKRHNAPMCLREVLDIGLQLCEVLSYLQSCQPSVKYRDLKPANIMCQPADQLVLIDFGLACPYHPGVIDAVTLGTPGYAAPEQYANKYGQGAATLQSDIYSLGVILHQLLSGEHPAKKPLKELFTFSSLAGKTVPDLAALVAQMLAHEPGERIGTICEVQHVLEAVQAALLTRCPSSVVLEPL